MQFQRLATALLVLASVLGSSESFAASSGKAQLRRPVNARKIRRPIESIDSRVASFIAESGGAQSFERGFAAVKDGVPGQARRVVTISRAAFAAFANKFSTRDILFLYHAPNSRNVITAFNGFQGEQGRLLDAFQYNYPGTLLIPIVLTPEESQRAHEYFQLAGRVKRKSDIALFPWLLKNASGQSYTKAGNINLLSEWFMRMPVGASLDESDRREAYATTGLTPEVTELVQKVWTSPYSHQTLAHALDLHPADPVRLFKTPGMIANALLGSASHDRVPVVFRFVEDYATPLETNFNTWIDSDFNPGENG